MTTVYKVVFIKSDETGQRYFSSDVDNLDLIVEYRLGEKTLPPIGKLFCYQTYYDTIDKVSFPTVTRTILECKAEGVITCPSFWPYASFMGMKWAAQVWRDFDKENPAEFDAIYQHDYIPVSGGLLCDSITPIHVIGWRWQ